VDLIEIARQLRADVAALRFGSPVSHAYNPLEYAWGPHREYLARFGGGRPQVLLVGMNPGPFGMAQTGVPFGDVRMVRDWLGIEGRVDRPGREHPRRPIQGFGCRRAEVSGQRLWGWARAIGGTPERFFGRFFVANYCPLCFIEESGRNRTPDKLPAAERAPLFAACDRALRHTVDCLGPACVVGIGRFAAARAAGALADRGLALGSVPHPSPASPIANRGWGAQASHALRALGIELPDADGEGGGARHAGPAWVSTGGGARMKIAVGSQNRKSVTGHAGRTRRFAVWHVDPGAEPVQGEWIELPKELAFHEFHGEGPHPIDGVDVLIVGGAGPGFVRRLAARGVRVVQTSESDPAKAVRDYLAGTLAPAAEHQHEHGQGHSPPAED
jgi:single-strand selective monofunctional uracil DNA glycosylase